MRLLLTGIAGFIGFSLAKKLSGLDGFQVTGIDNINDYYDISLKHGRLKELGFSETEFNYNKPYKSKTKNNLSFVKLDIEDKEALSALFENEKFDIVFHLAAQAGVRYSLENPYAYINTNITGFMNILEACRQNPVKHLIFASSSSVYGANKKVPFSENDITDTPVSLYAATKKSNELMAHAYSYLYNIRATGLRFFTVYGPWGRPDMAAMIFIKSIMEDKPINIFNDGDMWRDFTYVDDIVNGLIGLLNQNTTVSGELYQIFNIGNSQSVKLMDFIAQIEVLLGKEAKKVFLPMQPGDVYRTYADVSKIEKEVGFKPSTDFRTGLTNLVAWYKEFYK